MFKEFDAFLAAKTWHTGNRNDMESFYTALSEYIEKSDFNLEKLEQYMLHKVGLTDEIGLINSKYQNREDYENARDVKAIDKLILKASGIYEYLKFKRKN